MSAFQGGMRWCCFPPLSRVRDLRCLNWSWTPFADTGHACLLAAEVALQRFRSGDVALSPALAGLALNAFASACVGCQSISTSQILPPKIRPKSTAVVARRLIGNALGISELTGRSTGAAKEAEEALSAARREKHDSSRRISAKNRQSAWTDE